MIALCLVLLYLLVFYSFAFQVGKASLNLSACKSADSLLPSIAGSFSECSGSLRGGVDQTYLSKPYLMCTATDAASAIMDFSKQKVDDGVVDSPPERKVGITPVSSPSPLKRVFSSLETRIDCTPQRKLYVDDAVDLNLVKDVEANSPDLRQSACTPVQPFNTPVQPSLMLVEPSCLPAKQRRLPPSRSQGALGVKKTLIRSAGLHSQSVGVLPRLRSSSTTEYRRKSIPSQECDGSRSISCHYRQSSLLETTKDADADDYFKPYSRWKEIMIGYAKVKAQEAFRLKALGID